MRTLTRREMVAYVCAASVIAVNGVSTCPAMAIQLEEVSIPAPSGRIVSAAMAVPATVPAPPALLIHGSSGLIDMYKSFAVEFAQEGFSVLHAPGRPQGTGAGASGRA